MSMNGLIDVHVLEETTSRVAGLTRSINKQVSVVEEVSSSACKALTPENQQYRNLGHFRDNAAAILKVYDQIEKASRRLHGVESQVSVGPGKLGWQEYIAVVTKARGLSSEFAQTPNFQRFPQLSNGAARQFQRGIENLQAYIRDVSTAVFSPVEGKRFLPNEDPLPEFVPENLATLSSMLHSLEGFREVTPETTDQYLIGAMNVYVDKSLKSALSEVASKPTPQLGESFELLCDKANAVLLNGLQILFATNPQRFQKLKEIANQLTENEKGKAASLVNANRRRSGPRSGGTPGSPGSPGRMTSPIDAPGAAPVPAAGNQGTRQASIEALQGPRPQPDYHPGAGSPGSGHRTSGPAPLSVSTAVASGPSGGPSTPIIVTSPANSGSTGLGSGAGTFGGLNWGSFEVIESSRHEQIPPEELAKSKREALATLVEVFIDIETQCRKSPITSEFGVSGGSLQFMKVLSNISSAGHGVEVVLSEVATRAYLAKPLPDWAVKSEPSPAARANPVSLYYSDCFTCLYSTLHKIASEQLDDVKKTGIFMLSNLATIEHFITGSKTETLASVRPKTDLMNSMGDIAVQKFEKLMEQSFKEYLSDWSKLAPHLMESTITGATNSKLSSKDREVVKEKFKQFNSEFEALVERQKRYQVSDSSLRLRMGQEVKKLIGPLYMRFYLKHKDGDFTKNIAKYVKYTPAQVDEYVMF